jgi:uncharacterized protein (DUF1501 family)
VLADWKPLDDANLYEGRDLPVTTDYRAALAALLTGHLGVSDIGAVFPGFPLSGAGPEGWPRLV